MTKAEPSRGLGYLDAQANGSVHLADARLAGWGAKAKSLRASAKEAATLDKAVLEAREAGRKEVAADWPAKLQADRKQAHAALTALQAAHVEEIDALRTALLAERGEADATRTKLQAGLKAIAALQAELLAALEEANAARTARDKQDTALQAAQGEVAAKLQAALEAVAASETPQHGP